MKADAFPLRVWGAKRANIVEAYYLLCDSGATCYITARKHCFGSYTNIDNPESILISNKNVLMQA
jgi:hypothetical protein